MLVSEICSTEAIMQRDADVRAPSGTDAYYTAVARQYFTSGRALGGCGAKDSAAGDGEYSNKLTLPTLR